jgi:hypothetical protein
MADRTIFAAVGGESPTSQSVKIESVNLDKRLQQRLL